MRILVSLVLAIAWLKFCHSMLKAYEGGRKQGASRKDLIRAVLKMTQVPCQVSGLSSYNRDIGPDLKSFQDDGELKATSEQLKSYLNVSESDVQDLQDLHETIVKLIPTKLKDGEFKGRGIVMSTDGIYFPSALAAVKWMRNRGYRLPIEIYIARKRSWESACDEVLPALNVTCRCLEELYGESFKALAGGGGFLYKPLSIMMSDFDEIYWTDPDSLPLVDVEDYLKEPLFQKIGYIFTSDYWPRSNSPYFYDVTNVTLGPDEYGSGKRLRQIDRENAISGLSTESCQFFIKKSLHYRSLVLTLYYNIKNSIWWPLLSQAAPGGRQRGVARCGSSSR